jgi:hypothetical protein
MVSRMAGCFLQVLQGVFPPLTDVFPLVAVPGTLALDNPHLLGNIQDTARLGNAFAKHDVKFRQPKRGGDFIFGDFHLDPDAKFLRALFQGLDAANIQPYRGVKLEGVAAGGGFRVAVGNANFLPQFG